MTAGVRLRATFESVLTAAGAALSFVPFVPGLLRAAFTGRRDRENTLALIRRGRDAVPDAPPPVEARALRVLLVAGEPSGDLHGADLARALLEICPGSRLQGVGGPRMADAGVELLADLVSDPVMGVWPVVRRAPQFFRLYRSLLIRLSEDPPDVVVGIDYPGLNLRLARAARARGVPFVEYIAPQVWAWAPWRTRKLARDVSRVVTILPFEKEVFGAAGADVVYVGHPLFGHLAARPGDRALRERLRSGGGTLVALLPGSRRAEIRANAPLLLGAARALGATCADIRFVVPIAADRLRETWDDVLATTPDAPPVETTGPGTVDDVLAAADGAITVSGTATLHVVAAGTPAVVVYRTSPAGRALSRLLLVSPYFALPNLLAGDEILPEFLAVGDEAERIAAALVDLLPGGCRHDAARAAMTALRERLTTPDAPRRAALWVADAAGTRGAS